MTAFLPSNLLALFAPRPAIRYLPPLDKARHQKKPWLYTGVCDFLNLFEVGNTEVSTHDSIIGNIQVSLTFKISFKVGTYDSVCYILYYSMILHGIAKRHVY